MPGIMQALQLISIFVIASVLPVNAEYVTPTDGKFFYSKLFFRQGQSYMQLGIGAKNEEINFLMNTEELTLAVFTTNCSIPVSGFKCDVPNPYDPEDDLTRSSQSKSLTYEKAFLFDHAYAGIVQVGMSGVETLTIVNASVPQHRREYWFLGDLFEIIQINGPYHSKIASGMIGLAPYPAVETQAGANQRVQLHENFLYQLKDGGHINYQIVSIFMDKEDEDNGFVKFGGYDPEGFKNIDDVKIIETISPDTWSFHGQSTSIKQNGKSQFGAGYNRFIIEPAYPFIYLPIELYREYKNWLSIQAGFVNVLYSNDMIKFDKSCEWVKAQGFNMQFEITIDETTRLTLDLEDMLVTSQVLDVTKEDDCFLGIHPGYGAKDPSAIYLGQLYLHKYYTYFDIQGYQSGQTQNLRIGTGLRNPDARILDDQYKKDENGNDNEKKKDRSNEYGKERKPDIDDQESNDEQNGNVDDPQDDQSGGSKTTMIIIIIAGVILAFTLAAIIYCKCKRASDVKNETPIGEDMNASLNDAQNTSMD